MIEPIKIISKCAGINNKIDSKWLRQNDPQTGLTDLAEGVNVDVDDAWKLSVRLGQESISTNASHSLFCDGGDCFVALDRTNDAAIYRINNDFSLTGVRSGLIKGAYFSYVQVGARTFYTNGTQNGVIENGVSTAWPSNTYKGPDTLKEYSPAPVGDHLAYHQGRIWISIDEGGKFPIYCSEPYKPGLFRFAKYHFQFGSHVRMIRPVLGGVWISDAETTGFIASSDTWDGQKYARKSQYPAHEWSDNCRLVDLSKSQWKVPGLSAVWSSDEGLCIGTSDGQLIIATEDRLVYPTGASGATVVDGTNVINSIY